MSFDEENVTNVHAKLEGPGAITNWTNRAEMNVRRGIVDLLWEYCPLFGRMCLIRSSFFVAFTEGTPYEGGVFQCKLHLGQDFPQVPPKGQRPVPSLGSTKSCFQRTCSYSSTQANVILQDTF